MSKYKKSDTPNIDHGTKEKNGYAKGVLLPPKLKPFDIVAGDTVKIFEDNMWKTCKVLQIYQHIVLCITLSNGTNTTFRILDYLHNDGVRKVAAE